MIHSFFAGMIFMAISIFIVKVGARKIAMFRRRETLMQVIIFLIFGIIWVGIANAADHVIVTEQIFLEEEQCIK